MDLVEVSVETADAGEPTFLADGRVEGIAGRQTRMPVEQQAGDVESLACNRKDGRDHAPSQKTSRPVSQREIAR